MNFNGLVYADVPPVPNVAVLAAQIPTAAPSVQNRSAAQFVADSGGMISMTHSSSAITPAFTMLIWSDTAGFWIQPEAAKMCAAGGLVTWKVMPNTPVYFFASTALIGANAKFVVGAVTIQGNTPVLSAGV